MNLEHESTSVPDNNSTGWFDALRLRYRSIFDKNTEQSISGDQTRFGQKVINSTILFVLLIAILMIFGIGLSWFNGDTQKDLDSDAKLPATKSASVEAPAASPHAPAQPAGPAGHAEVRQNSEPEKKTQGK